MGDRHQLRSRCGWTLSFAPFCSLLPFSWDSFRLYFSYCTVGYCIKLLIRIWPSCKIKIQKNKGRLRQFRIQINANGKNETSKLIIIVITRMRFQHDGCPAHFALQERGELDRMFPQRWIGRGSTVHWPARSPDLTGFLSLGKNKRECLPEPTNRPR